jgi:hypothetical protein
VCPECGHANNDTAKLCSQCRHRFVESQPVVDTDTANENQDEGQKMCPKCGTVVHLKAKVCAQCGHHFRTHFEEIPAEPPIAAPLPPAISLPPEFTLTPPAPELPRLSGELAPDLAPDDLDEMRIEADDLSPHERLQQSLKRRKR